ncbi:hypothetical protein NM208_g4286 [Fusarium decemcellulare]|uniref:Uncharacterized protein n=1 Tax=Fusarium decemcellulare TaxID=57161 RepID=A0ACC1SL54_9HYPO|nr:hypothetical protein NM208_g4286 [Fusarium decemcellulare]
MVLFPRFAALGLLLLRVLIRPPSRPGRAAASEARIRQPCFPTQKILLLMQNDGMFSRATTCSYTKLAQRLPGSRIWPSQPEPGCFILQLGAACRWLASWLELCTMGIHFFGAAADETSAIPMAKRTMAVMTTASGFETGPFSHDIEGSSQP